MKFIKKKRLLPNISRKSSSILWARVFWLASIETAIVFGRISKNCKKSSSSDPSMNRFSSWSPSSAGSLDLLSSKLKEKWWFRKDWQHRLKEWKKSTQSYLVSSVASIGWKAPKGSAVGLSLLMKAGISSFQLLECPPWPVWTWTTPSQRKLPAPREPLAGSNPPVTVHEASNSKRN